MLSETDKNGITKLESTLKLVSKISCDKKLVLYDDRKKSRTKGFFQEIILSNKNHFLVSIPPNIWNGFRSADGKIAVLANCSDIPHDPEEIKRTPYNDKSIDYNWKLKI